MKYARKLITLAVVLAMVMAYMVPVAMADGTDGTITLSNAAIGKEYQAYKILDATYSGENIAYTTTDKDLFAASGSPWIVQETADANGCYNVQLATGKTVGDINSWIAANLSSFAAINPTTGVASDGKTANADTVGWNGLAYGYYYITSGLGTVVTVDSVKPSVTVIDKNETNPSNPAKTSDSVTAQIGDTVKFTVTFTATNYISDSVKDSATGMVTASTEQVKSYTVSDEADGFDYLIDGTHPVTVKVGDNEVITVNASDITVAQQTAAASGTMTFTIDWEDAAGEPLYNFSENVSITYYGIMNGFAYDGNAENSVIISNSTGKDTLDEKTTETKNYSLTINKVDEENNALTGAKFELRRTAADGTAVSLVDITDTVSGSSATRYFRVAEEGENGVTTIELTEDTYSSAVIYGLDGADSYFIEETEAPKGYNKLPAAQEHAMNNANGTENIVNLFGVVLPSTGGMGTTLFYVLGGIMVLAALVILVTNKRMRNQ